MPDPLRVAADAIGAIGAAQHRLSSSCYPSATSEEGISAIAHAQEQALLATQRAAEGISDAAADAAAAVDQVEKVASAKAAATNLLLD
eukprot:3728897-Prymnesium_polylepis.1